MLKKRLTKMSRLTPKQVRDVRKALWPARPKWYSIGIEFGIDVTKLDVIRNNNRDNADECLTPMVTEYVKSMDPVPSWSAIVEALREPPVGEDLLAQQIEDKHVCGIGNGVENHTEVPSLPRLGDRPTFKQLTKLKTPRGDIKLMDKIAHKWSKIANNLGFDYTVGPQISEQFRGNSQKSCEEIFRRWLDDGGQEDVSPATWSVLIELLEDIGNGVLATELRDVIRK